MSTCVICVCILVHTYTPTLKKYVSTKGEAKGRPGGILQIVPLPRLLNITSTPVLRNLLATVVPCIFGQVTSDQKYKVFRQAKCLYNFGSLRATVAAEQCFWEDPGAMMCAV